MNSFSQKKKDRRKLKAVVSDDDSTRIILLIVQTLLPRINSTAHNATLLFSRMECAQPTCFLRRIDYCSEFSPIIKI